jgi:adenosylcobinamide-phosphate synthase
VPARADDVTNLLPARLGAVLIALAAATVGGSTRVALATATRDHRRTESPNAGWTMAAMAGALNRRLEKVDAYRLGEGPMPAPIDIRRAQRVTAAALVLGAGLCVLTAMAMPRHRGGR